MGDWANDRAAYELGVWQAKTLGNPLTAAMLDVLQGSYAAALREAYHRGASEEREACARLGDSHKLSWNLAPGSTKLDAEYMAGANEAVKCYQASIRARTEGM